MTIFQIMARSVERFRGHVIRLVHFVVGWFVLVPLSCVVPKHPRLSVFCGRTTDGFGGNTKYVYLYGVKHCWAWADPVYVTRSDELLRRLRHSGLPAVRYPSARAAWLFLRAKVVFFDDGSWRRGLPYYLLFRASTVQLWHGMGMKKVQRLRNRVKESLAAPWWTLGRIGSQLRGESVRYDVVLFNSELQRRHRADAFSFRQSLVMTHPRLDPLISGRIDEDMFIGADEPALRNIIRVASSGDIVILIAPTHRKSGSDPIGDGALDLERLGAFAEVTNVHFVIKYHPKTEVPDTLREAKHPRLTVYGAKCDVMPLLSLTDILVTDYSSIYSDFLVRRRPVVFFPYDLERYRNVEDRLQMDYEAVTPGAKCFDQSALEHALEEVLAGNDAFRTQRETFLREAFFSPDGRSAEKLWRTVGEQLLGCHMADSGANKRVTLSRARLSRSGG